MNPKQHYVFTLPKWFVWVFGIFFLVARYPEFEIGLMEILSDLGVVP